MKKLAALLFLLFTVQTWAQVDVWQKQLDNTTIDTTRARLMYQVAWELKYSDINASLSYADSAFQIAEQQKLIHLYINCVKLKGILERLRGNYHLALEYCSKALRLSGEKGDGPLLISSLNEMGNLYSDMGDHVAALHYYDQTIRLAERIGNCKMMMKALSNKAQEISFQGFTQKAMELHYQSLHINLSCNDKESMANTKLNLGILYGKMGRFTEATQLFREALTIYKDLGNKMGMSEAIKCLANVHFITGDFTKALAGYRSSLKIADDISYLKGQLSNINNIAGVLASMGQFDESIIWIKKAIALGRTYQHQNTITTGYVNLSDIYLAMNDLPKALAYGDSGKYMAIQENNPEDLVHAFNNLFRIYESMGNYKFALENYRQHISLRDSLYSTDAAKKAKELEVKYQVEVQKKQMELLKEQEKVQILQTRQKNYWIAGLTGGIFFIIGLVVVIIVMLVSRSQKKEAVFARKEAELEQQALRSQMNPHFIFNSLNSIQRLYVEHKTNVANEYMADFSTLMRKILDNSIKNKITIKEELSTLELYLEMEKLRCGELLEYQISLDPEIDVLNTLVPPMVIQPFVENAIWHGILPKKEKGTVKISFQKLKERVICTIEDDGVGLSDKPGNHEPMGIKLTEQRLKTKIKVERLSPGTRFSFILPV